MAAGRQLLEEEGLEALTMRRLAERVGIRAPSLYKHLPDKAALEAAIIATGFEEAAASFEQAVEGVGEGPEKGRGEGPGERRPAARGNALEALAAAYRRFALEHPHLYRLMNNGPLPREHLPPGLENRTAAPLLRVAGSQARARAVWAFAHGMVMLELDQRFPPDADLDAAWRAGIAAFQAG
ncbi:MAG TPA: TetR-like C-terminal domain-containing protein [Actinomycetota bacterium]